jgi:hypothetical protein
MTEQQRLFPLAVEVVNLHALHHAGEGWSVGIAARRQGEPWGDAAWTQYSHLSTAELIQTIEDHLSSVL